MWFNYITHARIRKDRGKFMIMHPSNDAILAEADTETEAKQIVTYLDDMYRKCGPKEK